MRRRRYWTPNERLRLLPLHWRIQSPLFCTRASRASKLITLRRIASAKSRMRVKWSLAFSMSKLLNTVDGSQVNYEAVALDSELPPVWAVLMCLYGITTECNGTSETAHWHTDDDRYDICSSMSCCRLNREDFIRSPERLSLWIQRCNPSEQC